MSLETFVLPTPATSHRALMPNWPNAHGMGIILKEVVRRATVAIRAQRLIFEATPKDTPGRPGDLVTSADFAAQAIYVKILREAFPGIGIIAEEHELHLPCELPGVQIYAAIDPLDGTKAFGRRQPSGVATQVAIIAYVDERWVVLAAFVGDVNTREIYGYRPGSAKVHRITDLTSSEDLSRIPHQPLAEQIAVLREHPEALPWPLQQLCRPAGLQPKGGLVKAVVVDSGSMTLTCARQWIGQAGLLINKPNRDTPWDLAPQLGISRRLGLEHYTVDADAQLVPFDWQLRPDTYERTETVIQVHPSRAEELLEWWERSIVAA